MGLDVVRRFVMAFVGLIRVPGAMISVAGA
jgi:hypothetical protein